MVVFDSLLRRVLSRNNGLQLLCPSVAIPATRLYAAGTASDKFALSSRFPYGSIGSL